MIMFEQTSFKTFLLMTNLFSHNAGNQPDNTIKNDHSCLFSPRQDIITNAYLCQLVMVNYPLIQTFVTTA